MTQDRIPLDAESSRPAMEGETNELDARGLLYAETAVHFAGDDADAKALAEAAIRAYRKHSALPSGAETRHVTLGGKVEDAIRNLKESSDD